MDRQAKQDLMDIALEDLEGGEEEVEDGHVVDAPPHLEGPPGPMRRRRRRRGRGRNWRGGWRGRKRGTWGKRRGVWGDGRWWQHRKFKLVK